MKVFRPQFNDATIDIKWWIEGTRRVMPVDCFLISSSIAVVAADAAAALDCSKAAPQPEEGRGTAAMGTADAEGRASIADTGRICWSVG